MEMIFVQRAIGADRESDAVNRERITVADGGEIPVRRPARARVVFRMDLEEADIGRGFEDRAGVLGACAVRSLGMSCWMLRETAALMRSPYWAAEITPSGNAALVTPRQLSQR